MNSDNYKIINLNNKTKLCYVFFSSNGIINPNRSLNEILENDYYEFLNVASSKKILKKASKIIFLRDLELNFFVNGINNQICSISKVMGLLCKETEGYDVIAVGYSAGGYMAAICALELLNVKRAYSFGGVFNLYSWKGSHLETSYSFNSCLVENQHFLEKEKYYNLLPRLSGLQSNKCVYHFFANKSESDLLVVEELKHQKLPDNFHFVELNSQKHGGDLGFYDYVGILSKPINSDLKFKKTPYTKTILSIKAQGIFSFVLNKFRDYSYKRGAKNGN